MKTLYAKLSFALLCIVVLIGGSFLVLAESSTRLYYEEVTQRLNASIAMYIAGEQQLISNGIADRSALDRLAQQAMVINPSVEIYLLDAGGRILDHALEPETVVTDHVDLEPLEAFIHGGRKMPLRGTDPRNNDRRKIFSAYPVMQGGALQGYVYAVLGGRQYDDLASTVRGSYIQQVTGAALVTLALVAFLTGLLVFGLLTRRLRRLAGTVRNLTDADFDPEAIAALAAGCDPVRGRRDGEASDEIGQLHAAFMRMTEKIRDQFDALRETDRLRRELVTNVSHDLRTPLASMHGYVETLLIRNDTLSADERKRYLEIAHRHSQRLARLVGDLFELAKLESASVRPSLEHFSLAELLHDVAQEFELDAAQKGVTLTVETSSITSPVYADIGLMQRVLENLVRNAMKYTPRGGDICISLEQRPDQITVAVVDTGCGIAKEDLGRVFDRFYRSDGAADGSASAGLGLAIVRRILDLHGSRITVTSEPDKGSRFEFALAIGRAA